MKMNKKTILGLIFLVVALGLLIAYIYKDLNKKDGGAEIDTNKSNEITDGSISGAEKIIKEGNYTDENGLNYNVEKVTNNQLPPAPNLNKAIVFGDNISQTEKTSLTKTINSIISLLKKDSTSFNNWIELGSNRKAAGDYQGAIEAWEYASKIESASHLPYHNLGNLYHYYIKDYSKSEQNFLIAIEKNSGNIISYLGLFDLYSLSYKQNTNSAENILLKGINNNSGDINLLVTLADYYKEKGNKSSALNYYKQALEIAKKLNNSNATKQLQDKINSLQK